MIFICHVIVVDVFLFMSGKSVAWCSWWSLDVFWWLQTNTINEVRLADHFHFFVFLPDCLSEGTTDRLVWLPGRTSRLECEETSKAIGSLTEFVELKFWFDMNEAVGTVLSIVGFVMLHLACISKLALSSNSYFEHWIRSHHWVYCQIWESMISAHFISFTKITRLGWLQNYRVIGTMTG